MIKKQRGTADILPSEMLLWQYIEKTMREEAALYGFEETRFPTFEATELFSRGVGGTTDVVQKEMYTFEDRDGRSISLRPEGTAGVARSVLENGLLSGAMPLKLYYIANFFRYENRRRAEAANSISSVPKCTARTLRQATRPSYCWAETF